MRASSILRTLRVNHIFSLSPEVVLIDTRVFKPIHSVKYVVNGNVIEKHVVNDGDRTYAASKGHRQVAMRLGNLSHT